ncbi:AAA family ATPase [Paenibacillus taichungensis]|uniref:UvrD-helicase domain-containing protein n=1 Tax=Paenibacillus taichungensis TaxID=484184 RepID=UPI002DB8A55C|nr:UvrD-helicase domain-containing protein [Paenibacillus taichungensis]MEC0107368.1 AAA family ATPase [Paenibacillus taichungensis]MEC0195562.1 AAA family ATPase [Paenibacillus taichungensis]
MNIIVAGAGAGKTTSMASHILNRLEEVEDGMILYVITYTNSAKNKIRELIIENKGIIPKQLRIETIHAFLLHEVIYPFHHLLFEGHFNSVSYINLPTNRAFSAGKLKELKQNNSIHVEKVTETAKWILCKKTGDNKLIKEKREKIINTISRYLDCVYIDEAQDMDEHMTQIVKLLDNKGLYIFLIGDPKQDLRGRNFFSNLLIQHQEAVVYEPTNHRSPISHVNFSNHYIPFEQKQIPLSKIEGEINFVFEKEIISSEDFFNNQNWDRIYIYQKNNRFNTHEKDKANNHNLIFELDKLISRTTDNEKDRKLIQYELLKDIFSRLKDSNNYEILLLIEKVLNLKLNSQDKAKIHDSLKIANENSHSPGILVNSIDSVKGLEGEKCLFIVTTEVAEYLLGIKKDQNKMMNYLYVALTRSKRDLVLFITLEVHLKYTIQNWEAFFSCRKISKYISVPLVPLEDHFK